MDDFVLNIKYLFGVCLISPENFDVWCDGMQISEMFNQYLSKCTFSASEITFLLTPWNRVLLEKLTSSQLVKKFPAFCGPQRFITAFTSVCHLSLSWASLIPMPLYFIFWRSIVILSSHLHLGLPSGLFSLSIPTKTLYTLLLSPILAICHTHHILLNLITLTILGEEYRLLSSSLCNFLHSPVTSSLLGPNILLNTLFSSTPSAYIPPWMWATKLHTHTKQEAKL